MKYWQTEPNDTRGSFPTKIQLAICFLYTYKLNFSGNISNIISWQAEPDDIKNGRSVQPANIFLNCQLKSICMVT